jgi:hypothetical protein
MQWIGPDLICSTMSTERLFPKKPKPGEQQWPWQYHSRSDDHSNIAGLGVTLDLLQESAELRRDVEAGLVGYQVNPRMRDRNNTPKTLDLGLGYIDDAAPTGKSRSLTYLLEDVHAILTPQQMKKIQALPVLREAKAKQNLVVLENKACMTAHGKAAPRLRNELEGAVDAINRTDSNTVAGGLVLVNAAATFVSPVFKNNSELSPADRRQTFHNQPEDAARAVRKLKEIPLRQRGALSGYDALGILVVRAPNDGVTPWSLVDDPETGSPPPDDIYNYTKFIQTLAAQYRLRWRR